MSQGVERRRHKLTGDGMEEILSVWDEDDVDEDEIIEFQRGSPETESELISYADGGGVITNRDESSKNGYVNATGLDDLSYGHQRQRSLRSEKIGLYCETGCILLAFFGLVRYKYKV